jgi:multiple sugar transport system permease protein
MKFTGNEMGLPAKIPLRQRMTGDHAVKVYFLIPSVLFLVALILYPVFSAIVQSFVKSDYFAGTATFVGFENYLKVFGRLEFWNALKVDVIWTIGCIIGQFALGLVAALLISRPGRAMVAVRSILLIPYIIPAISLTLVFRWMLNDTYGIITHILTNLGIQAADTSLLSMPGYALMVVMLVEVYRTFPFLMICYWASLQAIPQDLYEAAGIDGANGWQQFLYITLPNLKTITLTLLILRTIWEFNYFDVIYLLTKGGPAQATQHLPILVYMQSMGMFDFGTATAISIIMGLILTAFIIFYLKIFGKEELN